jgi:hypothetical protein
VRTNAQRSREEMEYELLDTGVFDEDRYFDVFVEYAKAGPEDILVRITAHNRGPDAAELHLLPTLWFRNDWASWITEANRAPEKPDLGRSRRRMGSALVATHRLLGEFVLSCEGGAPLLFTDNSTNNDRLFPGRPTPGRTSRTASTTAWCRAGLGAVNPEKEGTKASAHYRSTIAAGGVRHGAAAAAQENPLRPGPRLRG